MSTGIYDAYKVKRRADIWPILEEIKRRGMAEATQRIEAFYWWAMTHIDTECEEYQNLEANSRGTHPGWNIRLQMVHKQFEKDLKEQAFKPTRGKYDIEVAVAVYAHESGFYLRALCDRVSCLGGSLDFLRTHPQLVDFHYQNSADRPESLSAAQWRKRKKVWDELSDESVMLSTVVVDIVHFEHWWLFNPVFRLRQKYEKSPPKLPIREDVLAGRLRELKAFSSVKTKKGLIVARLRGSKGTVQIKKGRKLWTTIIGTSRKAHPMLEQAIDHVWYCHIHPEYKRQIDSLKAHMKKTYG